MARKSPPVITSFWWRDSECKRLWLLKNSLFVPNSRNLGDRKCLGDPRKSIVGLPDAILFLRILQEGVFQQPRLVTPTDPCPNPIDTFADSLQICDNWRGHTG
jgi:hypothetical protein